LILTIKFTKKGLKLPAGFPGEAGRAAACGGARKTAFSVARPYR
jgi:hypothetical protein